MALTPLVVPKRNSRTINFTGPFTIIGAFAPPSVFLATPISTNCPYPQLSSGGGVDDDFYYGAFLSFDTIIGKYFNTPDIATVSGKAIGLTSDKSTMYLVWSAFPAVGIDVKGPFASDPIAYSLGPQADPPDNTYVWAGGLQSIQNRDTLLDVYTLGTAIPALRDDGSGTDGLYAVMDNGGVFHNAFKNDPSSNIFCDSFITLNDTIWNYTFVVAFPNAGTNGVYMSKWQPNAYNPAGVFTYTNYLVELSDAADDTFFQAGNDYFAFGGDRYIHANNNTFVYIFDTGATPLAAQTVFIFANDLSWYDRFDITVDNSILSGTYFQDFDGNDYMIGKTGVGNLVFQSMVPPPAPAPVPYGGGAATNPLRLSEIIKLPCWHPCVPNMKKGPAIV